MGLDMYLDRAKRINGATPNDIDIIKNYFDYQLRPSEYMGYSMKRYCGIDKKKVNMELADAYRKEYQTKYYVWDDEKKYGHLGLWEGVAYWRKANQIHNWFVLNVQNGEDDCGTYEVSEEQLQELLDTCIEVKENSVLVKGKVMNGKEYVNGDWKPIWEDGEIIEDPTTAMELLPTQSGFFFGGTDYDNYYMEEIDRTIKQIRKVLETTDFEKEMVAYSASW